MRLAIICNLLRPLSSSQNPRFEEWCETSISQCRASCREATLTGLSGQRWGNPGTTMRFRNQVPESVYAKFRPYNMSRRAASTPSQPESPKRKHFATSKKMPAAAAVCCWQSRLSRDLKNLPKSKPTPAFPASLLLTPEPSSLGKLQFTTPHPEITAHVLHKDVMVVGWGYPQNVVRTPPSALSLILPRDMKIKRLPFGAEIYHLGCGGVTTCTFHARPMYEWFGYCQHHADYGFS